MNVVVAIEHRFDRTPDGAVWTQAAFPHSFWKPYLQIFEKVTVVARLRDGQRAPAKAKRADGPMVCFSPIPHYIGPAQYLARFWQIRRAARSSVGKEDAVILRLGSNIGTLIEPVLRSSGHPYAVEVGADPYDAFAPGCIKHPLRPFFRWLFVRQQQRQCTRACAAAYVTRSYLQSRYPAGASAFSTSFSDAEMTEEAFAEQPRSASSFVNRRIRIIAVGSLAQMYKGTDVLIDAVRKCVEKQLNLELVIIGDGKHRMKLEERARTLGERATFLGQISSGAGVRAHLDSASLFVLPSRSEGLPRALLEGMARGLPCLASPVGGIPELLPAECLVPVGDARALAQKIQDLVREPRLMAEMSAQNVKKAREYHERVLNPSKIAFYRFLRDETERWLTRGRRAMVTPRQAVRGLG